METLFRGKTLKIKTDHSSLKYLLDQNLSSESQHLWLAKLLGLDYVVIYRKGKENTAADALSRVTGSELLSMTISTASTDLLEPLGLRMCRFNS